MPNPNEQCERCGLLRSTCEMENGSDWTKNCKKVEGQKHDFISTRCGEMILTPTPEHGGGLWCGEQKPCKRHPLAPTPANDTWEEEFKEYFDKTLKPKKPTMKNLDRELIVNFIQNLLTSERQRVLDFIADDLGWEENYDYYAKKLNLPTKYGK